MSKTPITIAIDAMGGDFAPVSVIEGLKLFSKKTKLDILYKIYGDESKVLPLLKKVEGSFKYDFIHTSEVVSSNDKPSDVLRKSTNTSMRLAINAVASGEAHAVMSAGNTGALMALSRFILKMLPNIDRPAIVTYIPSKKKPVVILDLGANAACKSNNLAEFAIMGSAFSKAALGVVNPTVGLLNIGSEAIKGNEVVQEAHGLISENKNINYIGFVEGGDYFSGDVDVVVSDGFTGNIALKVLEGMAKFAVYNFKGAIKSSFFAKIGLLFLIPSLLKLKNYLDPKNYNGAMFVGVNGISIKCHGNSDAKSFSKALEITHNLIKNNINEKIKEELLAVSEKE